MSDGTLVLVAGRGLGGVKTFDGESGARGLTVRITTLHTEVHRFGSEETSGHR